MEKRIALFTLKSTSTKGGGGQRYNHLLERIIEKQKSFKWRRYFMFDEPNKKRNEIKIGEFKKYKKEHNLIVKKRIDDMFSWADIVIISTAMPIKITHEQSEKCIHIQHSEPNKNIYLTSRMSEVFKLDKTDLRIYNFWDTYYKYFKTNIFFYDSPFMKKTDKVIITGVGDKSEMSYNKKKECDIVFIGRIDDRAKRVKKILRPLSKKYLIHIYGPKPKMKLKGMVWKGFSKDPLKTISSARINVLPSIKEGFGLSIAEASCVGVISVYYDGWGAAKLLSANGNNVILKRKSKKAFKKGIEKALKKEVKKEELIKFSKENYSLEQFEKKWMDVLNEKWNQLH